MCTKKVIAERNNCLNAFHTFQVHVLDASLEILSLTSWFVALPSIASITVVATAFCITLKAAEASTSFPCDVTVELLVCKQQTHVAMRVTFFTTNHSATLENA